MIKKHNCNPLAMILVLFVLCVAPFHVGVVGVGAGDKTVREDPSALPKLDINLESLYYERALTPSESTLLASTLDGTLVALNQLNGEILWELRDEPVVKSPFDSGKPVLPAFLPDPKDGSIYIIGGGLKDPLKKLPYTIPELVAASPCKSTDGILYIGKKVDTWFSIDRYTGSKDGSISFSGCLAGMEDQCPNLKPTNILIGRTEYNIMMYDSRTDGRRWNISFFDYSTNLIAHDVGPEYELAHFADSSSGSLVTLDRKSGVIQWERQIGSPIVAMYRLEEEGIVSIPFTSVSKETLANLMDQFNAPETNNEIIGETKLFPTLYVGEHDHGLFAMPSLVDEKTLTISPSTNGPLLLEGPRNFNVPSQINIDVTGGKKLSENIDDPLGIPRPENHKDRSSVLLFDSKNDIENGTTAIDEQELKVIDESRCSGDCSELALKPRLEAILLGHYQVPEHSSVKLNTPTATHLQVSSQHTSSGGISIKKEIKLLPPGIPSFSPLLEDASQVPPKTPNLPPYQNTPRDYMEENSVGNSSFSYNTTFLDYGIEQLQVLNMKFIFSRDMLTFLKEFAALLLEYFSKMENKELKAIVFLLVIAVFVLFRMMQNYSQNMSQSSVGIRIPSSSIGSTGSQSGGYEVTAHPIELKNGTMKVGNITFDPKQILGKGCEGTFVYKGRFDNRDVAVKTVLAACFSIADREVDLLRESDEHPNVIRYFCMEQDLQFRYIALEYCVATLQDLIEGKYIVDKLDPLSILKQATSGLNHLHHLDIVHRDVKPHNVLISTPGKKGEVRAMISDFGLCKKLKVGRNSFSRRSGVAGTDGWIAPEMMLGNRSTTCAVDIFSLGCVYYFVLSKGHHPFGDSFRRQANILSGEYNLQKISNEIARNLIIKMINREQKNRPTCEAVLKHPLFWKKETTLNFLQDISDRIDKEDPDSVIVSSLERGGEELLNGSSWHDCLDFKIREDLRKHRSYNGKSIRDLLRALRNKKHHYNELPDDIKNLYGRIPDKYVDYWTSRFPRLVIHSWQAMHCIKNETIFQKYFDKHYDFLQDTTVVANDIESSQEFEFRPETLVENYQGSSRNHLENRHNLFEPYFLTEDQQNPGENVNSESQTSVISNWDNIDSGLLDNMKCFPTNLKELEEEDDRAQGLESCTNENGDSGDDLVERVPTKNSGPGDKLVKEVPTKNIYPGEKVVKEVPTANPESQNTTTALPSNNLPRKRVVAQLTSQTMEEEKLALRPSWSEALQNITAKDKIRNQKIASLQENNALVGASSNQSVDEVNEQSDTIKISEKGGIMDTTNEGVPTEIRIEANSNCDSNDPIDENCDEIISNDSDGSGSVNNEENKCEAGLSGQNPVWILPPPSTTPSKKKKKKKPKNKKPPNLLSQ